MESVGSLVGAIGADDLSVVQEQKYPALVEVAVKWTTAQGKASAVKLVDEAVNAQV